MIITIVNNSDLLLHVVVFLYGDYYAIIKFFSCLSSYFITTLIIQI